MSIANSIKKIQKINSVSKKDVNTASKINNTVVLQVRSLKIKKSNVFKKNKFKLRVFLIQTELYINFNVNKINKNQKKILWAFIYFRDEAFDWVDIYVRDFINHKNDP